MSPHATGKNGGEPGGNRTLDPRIKSPLLYRLSYRPHNPAVRRLRVGWPSDAAAGQRSGQVRYALWTASSTEG